MDSTTGSHGACLVRLTLAETMAKEAQKVCATFATSIVTPGKDSSATSTLPADAATSLKTIIDTHLALVSARKATAVKDNDLIYHDILPTESTLPAIEPLATAKPISIQDIYSSAEVQKLIGANTAGAPSNDLFSTLVPLGVHEAASMYSEEKAKLVRAESERVSLTDGQLEAALEYLTLPRGLKRFKSDGIEDLADPGAEVRGWAEEEIEGGGSKGQDGLGAGSDAIDDALRNVDRARQRARGDLEEAQKTLDEEAAVCEKLRVRHGDKWSQSPSGMETKALRGDIKRNREALEQASDNDLAIQHLWTDSERFIRVLLGGKESLERAFAEALATPASRSNGSSQLVDLLQDDEGAEVQTESLAARVAAIESHLSMLQRIKKERADCLVELRSRVQSDDISHLLILNRRASTDSQTQLFQQELDKFRGTMQRILRNVGEQERVLGELTQNWKEINESSRGRSIGREWEEKSRAREQLVGQLKRAKDANAQVRAGLGKALAFYSELQEIATQLRRNARAFVEERAIERDRLLGEVEWQSGAGGSGSLEGAFGRMDMGGRGASRMDSAPPPRASYPTSPAPPPPPPQAPPLTSYMHSSPYGSLDAAFGSGMTSSRAAPAPAPYPASPPPLQTYTSAPPPPSHFSSFSSPPPPSGSQYGAPPPPSPQSSLQYGAPPPSLHYGGPPPPSSSQYPSPPPTSSPSSHYYAQPPAQYRQPSLPPPPPQWNSSYSTASQLPPPPPPPQSSQSYGYGAPHYPSGPPPPPLPTQQRQPSYSSHMPRQQPQQGGWQQPPY